MNAKQVAEKLGVSKKSLEWFYMKNGVSFTKKKHLPNETFEYKQRDWLIEQKEKGLCNGNIAQLCNTTEDKVKHSCIKLKVTGYVGKEENRTLTKTTRKAKQNSFAL